MPAGKLVLVPRKPARGFKPVIVPYASRSTPSYVKTKGKYKGKTTNYIQKLIKAMFNRGKETKYVADVLQNQVLGQAASTPAGFLRLVPNLAQGVGENQRIGDNVQGISLRTVFTFNFSSGLMNNQDVVVNLWIVTVKGASSAGALAGVTANQFLKVGNGGNADPNDPNQVNMIQMVNHYPLNTDQYTLKKHYRFRMRRGIGLAVNSNAGEVAPTGVNSNELIRVIKYSIAPPTLKFNTANDQTPSNFYPVALMYATNADGSAYGDVIQYTIRRELYYKDA